MGIHTILVADKEELRNLYQQQMTDLGLKCDAVANFHELYRALQDVPYNGLMIDLPTSIRANFTEKSLLHEVQQLYPVLRMKWDEQQQQLRCQLYGSIAGSTMTVETFINHHCRLFSARRIRKDKRLHLHLNVLLARNRIFEPTVVERSTTLDISKGGCLLFTTQNWQVPARVWLQFLEFEDQTPIEAEICHWTRWGTPLHLPSIGVKFISLSDSQREQLEHPNAICRKELA